MFGLCFSLSALETLSLAIDDDDLDLFFRLRRVDEFVRIQTLLRIEQETERTEKIKAEREFLVEQVRETGLPPFSVDTRVKSIRRVVAVHNLPSVLRFPSSRVGASLSWFCPLQMGSSVPVYVA